LPDLAGAHAEFGNRGIGSCGPVDPRGATEITEGTELLGIMSARRRVCDSVWKMPSGASTLRRGERTPAARSATPSHVSASALITNDAVNHRRPGSSPSEIRRGCSSALSGLAQRRGVAEGKGGRGIWGLVAEPGADRDGVAEVAETSGLCGGVCGSDWRSELSASSATDGVRWSELSLISATRVVATFRRSLCASTSSTRPLPGLRARPLPAGEAAGAGHLHRGAGEVAVSAAGGGRCAPELCRPSGP